MSTQSNLQNPQDKGFSLVGIMPVFLSYYVAFPLARSAFFVGELVSLRSCGRTDAAAFHEFGMLLLQAFGFC